MRAGQRVKQLRTEQGLTQKQLGERVGMLQHDLSRLEKKDSNVVVENWIRMAQALGVTVEELYGELPAEKI